MKNVIYLCCKTTCRIKTKQFNYKVRIIIIYNNESAQNNRVVYPTRFTKPGNQKPYVEEGHTIQWLKEKNTTTQTTNNCWCCYPSTTWLHGGNKIIYDYFSRSHMQCVNILKQQTWDDTFDIVLTQKCNKQLRWWCADDSSFYTIFWLKISQIWQ